MSLTKKQTEQQSLILETIHAKGPISRIDIANALHITPATVSELTGHMLEDNHIHELGEEETANKPGRKKILLDISAGHSHFVGIELSEKFLALCLSDNTGSIIEQEIFRYKEKEFREAYNLPRFLGTVHTFLEKCQSYRPQSIGIALPGHYDSFEKKILTNNPFWQNFPLEDIIAALPLPVYCENNVKCMATAERFFGSASQDPNFIFLHVSRGMFCTYMYNGDIYAGTKQLIGEIGHTTVNPHGERCECGKKGCLQTYASETWLVKKAKFLYDESPQNFLRLLVNDKDAIDIDTLIKGYKLGDDISITLLNQAVDYLSIAINNLFMIIDSEVVYLHGKIFSEPEISELLIRKLDENSSLLNLQQPQQRIFKPYDESNGALGACGLCVARTI